MECILLLKIKKEIFIPNTFIFKFGTNPYIIYSNKKEILDFLNENEQHIESKQIVYLSNNKLMNLLDYSNIDARMEPGAIIRENVTIDDTAIVLMGAVINTKACIGKRTMIDMNVVIGSGAIINDNCHIGAGCVIAGIMEPISTKPVTIKNNVFIGANCVILEGVTINENCIIGAGTIVTKDLDANTIIYEDKKYITKSINDTVKEKLKLNEDLRK